MLLVMRVNRHLLFVAVVAAVACGAVFAQAPRKARTEPVAPPPAEATFSGQIVQLRGRALPGMGETLTAFYARGAGEDLKRFVVSYHETGDLPKTRVVRGGDELSTPGEIEAALNEEGARVEVRHRPEQHEDWEAYVATEVRLGGAEVRTDATGAVVELQIDDIREGTGREARPGDTVTVHYTGWLLDGTKFDSSRDRDEPFSFRLGTRQVIRGWDLGVSGMRVGGVRRLAVPPGLAYGRRGAGGVIPANASLIFEIELLGVR